MTKSYTKNEIDLMHQPMHEKLDKILEQTTRHNGRMKKLEVWRGYITGAITVLILIVLPTTAWALNQIIETRDLLSAVEISIELE